MKKREGKQRERKEDEKKKRLKPREKIFFDSKHSVTPCQSLSLWDKTAPPSEEDRGPRASNKGHTLQWNRKK